MKLIADAVQKKDIILFEQHVDINSIIDIGYDKIIVFMMKQQKEVETDNPYALGFAQLVKPVVVSKFATETKNAIQDEFNKTANSIGKKSDESKEKKNSVARGIRDIKEEVRHDSDAIVSFVTTAQNGDDVIFRCRMEKLPNGEWKVIEIMNLDELFKKAIDMEKK